MSILLNSACGLIMPLTKSDGSLDVSSLLSHIALLEQTIESKASTTETAELKTQLQTALGDLKTAQADLKTTQSELRTAQAEMKALQVQLTTNQVKLQTTQDELKQVKADIKSTSVTQPSTDVTGLKAEVSTLKTEVFQLQSQRNASVHSRNVSHAGGATFTRWGRTVCPGDTKIIYKGYTGGTGYTDKASSATMLCLPEQPIYAVHTTGGGGSYIFGTEYETDYTGNPLKSLHDEDMPCVVCESETKRSVIMVPARNQCYSGWNLEYWGYVIGAGYSHASAEFICVDKDPETVPGGKDDRNGQLLYGTKSRCGSLTCPPYRDNWDLTCAICSQ